MKNLLLTMKMANAKNGSVLIDHTEMHYVSFGSGEKVLILLPGLSDGLTTVKGKALLLAMPYRLFFEEYTVYLFSRKVDLPDAYSIREMADDQAEAMRKLGITKASVLGGSQGGMIAQSLAADHAELLEKLVIAVSAPRVNERIRACVSGWIELAERGEYKKLLIDTAEKSYSPEYLLKYRKLYPFLGLMGRPSDFRRFLTNSHAILRFDVFHDLKRVTCPTLIVGGEQDQIVGVQASYEMHEQIASSILHVYSGLGHAAYEEAKDFNQRVYDFLET